MKAAADKKATELKAEAEKKVTDAKRSAEVLQKAANARLVKVQTELETATGEAFDIASSEYFADIVTLVKDIFKLIVTRDEPLLIYFNENSSIIYQDQELNDLFISSLMIYQKDIIDYKIGNMYHIAFEEEMDTIQAIARDKTKNRLIEELEEMLALKARIDSYINERLAYDNLLLSLERR